MPDTPPKTRLMAGQRLMVGFDGTEFNDELRWLIQDLTVGGLVLFAPNIESVDQIRILCRSAQNFARTCGLPPLFIAIDQEGGRVARLGLPFTRFPGNPFVKNTAQAHRFGEITACELQLVGINMNFAPVVDVLPLAGDSIMQQRSFGADPIHVAAMGAAVIDAMQKHRVMAVAKHFPGIGRTTLDSHLDLPDLDTSSERMTATDLVPFRTAIQRNVSGIMLSHIRFADLDPEWPASLSFEIAHRLLRQQLGYDGLILTDDLDMGAIQNHYEIDTVVDRIIAAQVDLALICHKGPNIEDAFTALFNRMDRSSKIRHRAELSLKRIWGVKRRYLNWVVQ